VAGASGHYGLKGENERAGTHRVEVGFALWSLR
jgi:hypothetical protein